MNYPTLEEIEAADHVTLARWYRFLKSPESEDEKNRLNRIIDRFNDLGGMTPTISKTIGWR